MDAPRKAFTGSDPAKRPEELDSTEHGWQAPGREWLASRGSAHGLSLPFPSGQLAGAVTSMAE